MSVNGGDNGYDGFDAADHQTAYLYTPAGFVDDAVQRPTKRLKISKSRDSISNEQYASRGINFEPLFNGSENTDCINIRQELYRSSWASTEIRIQSVLSEANEDTLAEVASFANSKSQTEVTEMLPAGFIVTGPNIASQGLLFNQLSARLKLATTGPVVILRSGDGSNLKAIIKQLIRDATSQKTALDENLSLPLQQDGHKLLNYDLEILHRFVTKNGSHTVVIAIQDSEAFDAGLVADLITLFSSWRDRIPFVLLFGVATSVDVFRERLSRAASRCLDGQQFNVEQTSCVLERIFQTAVAGSQATLRLSAPMVASLMERQNDHVQSVQSFAAALKYAYMCHFYGNPLSVLYGFSKERRLDPDSLQPEHFEAVRMLPSFRNLIEQLLDERKIEHAQSLLEDNAILLEEIEKSLNVRDVGVVRILRAIHVLASTSLEPAGNIELYLAAFDGKLCESNVLKQTLDSVKGMAPEEVVSFLKRIIASIQTGCPEMNLDGWPDEDYLFLEEVSKIQADVSNLSAQSKEQGKPIRSSYAIHSKGVRTTVIAQRVQLSFESSKISEQDKEFTMAVNRLLEVLTNYFTCGKPQDAFLHEVWLYDSTTPYKEVFTPRPRAAIERALSAPHDYLNCECCKSFEGCKPTQPATAIIYQMHLDAGSLINVADLWTAFLDNQTGEDGDSCDERENLVLFYRALADLKLLGMVKQSKKKADHLAKVLWKGL